MAQSLYKKHGEYGLHAVQVRPTLCQNPLYKFSHDMYQLKGPT